MKKEILMLQEKMKKHGIHMYLIPTGDEHQSEYVGEYYKFRAYLSGFTGSAGTLLVTLDQCLLWTDGRYFVQAAKELENSGIILMKSGEKGVPTIQEYISSNIKEHEVLGFDGALMNVLQGKDFLQCVNEKGGTLLDISLADEVWEDRPALNYGNIRNLDLCYAGCTVEEKLSQVREVMKKEGADVHVLSTLDDIAWLFNLRGCDIPYNPVFYSYAVITMDSAILFANIESLDADLSKKLAEDGVEIYPYTSFFEYVSEKIRGKNILLDKGRTSYKTYCILSCTKVFAKEDKSMDLKVEIIDSANELIYSENPTVLLKSIKNKVECDNLKKAHETDGLVMCKFIYWLKQQVQNGQKITECDAADYLDQLRLHAPDCVDLSFDTIAAYGANAAMCHYSPDRTHPVELKPEGFFLVDCGGQYLTGTTDITRTIALGPLSEEQKKHYTLVLKGHIRLAMARFPRGICGANLDILARGPLWQECLDFNHGTGHGVGYFLNVHEGPNNIHWNLQRKNAKTVPLQPGMLTSDEPGLYLEGKYGIRLENLILTKPVTYVKESEFEPSIKKENFKNSQTENHVEDERFLEFETVTKAPFEREAIIKELLSADEIIWLNNYHKSVYEMYCDKLSEEESIWLSIVTEEL